MGRKRTDGWGYVRAGVVSIEEVLPLISDPNIKKVEFHGHMVNVTSLRLRTFVEKGLCCSSCGLQATHFAVETKTGQEQWHLNLWADRSAEGKGEMLMTHDHTLARGLGGADHIDNVTTMCRKCNFEKSKGENIEYCKRNNLPLPGQRKDKVARTPEPVSPGQRVRKKSGNKFKSGEYIATVVAVCTSLLDPKRRLAYSFEEDDSIVGVDMCGVALPA